MKQIKLSIVPLLIMLAACSTLGIPPADTFNKKAAAAVTNVNTASQLTLTLLQARKISPDENDRYIDRAEEAQKGIDTARALHSTDPSGATDKLGLTINALAVLIAELEARK
jgi:hypothetical protein